MRSPGPWTCTCATARARKAGFGPQSQAGCRLPTSGRVAPSVSTAPLPGARPGTLTPTHVCSAWLTENKSQAPVDMLERAALVRLPVLSKAAWLLGDPGSQLHSPHRLVINHLYHVDTSSPHPAAGACGSKPANSPAGTPDRQASAARLHGHGQSNDSGLMCWFSDSC